jgi:hypothetical protein
MRGSKKAGTVSNRGFGDFRTVDGLTLPSHYDLRFTEELQNGFTKSLEWDITTTRVLNKVSLDPRNFQF